MALLVDFSNDTYFPQQSLVDVPSGFIIGYDPEAPASYFKARVGELTSGFGTEGSGVSLITGTFPEFTQRLLSANEYKGQNATRVIELSSDSGIEIKFDQDKINADGLVVDYAANNYSPVNSTLAGHLTGINVKLGTQAETYDSGWQLLRTRTTPATAGVLGFVPGEGTLYYNAPRIRVINRMFHFTGTIQIPVAASNGGAPVTNLDLAASTFQSYVGTGSSSGWALTYPTAGGNEAELVLANIFKSTNSRFLPTAIHHLGNIVFKRKIILKDDSNVATSEYGYLVCALDAYITINGDIHFTNLRSKLSGQGIIPDTGELSSYVNIGENVTLNKIPDSSDQTSTLVNSVDDGGARVSPDYTWPITFEGLVNQLGGFYADVSFSFPVSDSVTLPQLTAELSELLGG